VIKIYNQIFKNFENYSVDSKAEQLKLVMDDLAIFSVGKEWG
jgi:hypothetical protein